MMIVDAHLDLAYNALRGRDVRKPAVEQLRLGDHDPIPTCGLPDLRRGGVGLICATIYVEPSIQGGPGYRTAEEAHTEGLRQLAWYHEQATAGEIRLVQDPASLPGEPAPQPAAGAQDQTEAPHAVPAVLLLEGGDALRSPSDIRPWFDAGLRMVGLAWRRTRYAGGTGEPGPLTPDGVAIVPELDRFGIIHDASHLAEEAFWQLVDLSAGPLCATHSNSRSIVPTDRQLSDEMARAIQRRGGVIGINFFDKFLQPPGVYKTCRATLADVVAHVQRFCDLVGNADHVGIGTDLDGGLGREQIPHEIVTAGDLPMVADALSSAGFDDRSVRGIMGRNWIRFFEKNLPSRSPSRTTEPSSQR